MMENKKIFLITVDTEADNQWDVTHPITTENAKFIPRFQELSEKYHFKPVWLITYEMAQDPFLVKYLRPKQEAGLCEIGMHLHAWHTPPDFALARTTGQRDYLIEYPTEIMDKKIETMTKLIAQNFGKAPISHRSGRWAMDERYFGLLSKYGYKVDCSVTPYVNWSSQLGATGMSGSDYSNEKHRPYYVNSDILEVPMTVKKLSFLNLQKIHSVHNLAGEIKRLCTGRYQWLRPDKTLNSKGIYKLIDKAAWDNDYLMFMIHSSELMPEGSPNFISDQSIERLYLLIEEIFKRSTNLGYVGQTLQEFQNSYGEVFHVNTK